jgi:hypothetical protein
MHKLNPNQKHLVERLCDLFGLYVLIQRDLEILEDKEEESPLLWQTREMEKEYEEQISEVAEQLGLKPHKHMQVRDENFNEWI